MCQATQTVSGAADVGQKTCSFCKKSAIFSPRGKFHKTVYMWEVY